MKISHFWPHHTNVLPCVMRPSYLQFYIFICHNYNIEESQYSTKILNMLTSNILISHMLCPKEQDEFSLETVLLTLLSNISVTDDIADSVNKTHFLIHPLHRWGRCSILSELLSSWPIKALRLNELNSAGESRKVLKWWQYSADAGILRVKRNPLLEELSWSGKSADENGQTTFWNGTLFRLCIVSREKARCVSNLCWSKAVVRVDVRELKWQATKSSSMFVVSTGIWYKVVTPLCPGFPM